MDYITEARIEQIADYIASLLTTFRYDVQDSDSELLANRSYGRLDAAIKTAAMAFGLDHYRLDDIVRGAADGSEAYEAVKVALRAHLPV
jgi:hypothetical protein